MKQYTKKEYMGYVRRLNRDLVGEGRPISFEDWRKFQPMADRAIGVVNGIVKRVV